MNDAPQVSATPNLTLSLNTAAGIAIGSFRIKEVWRGFAFLEALDGTSAYLIVDIGSDVISRTKFDAKVVRASTALEHKLKQVPAVAASPEAAQP